MTQVALLNGSPLSQSVGGVHELSDRALLAALAHGDRAALAALYDRFHRDVHRFVARLLRQQADVEDLVQITFLEAHRSAPRFRADSAVKTWLFGIAMNLVREKIRSEQKHRRIACAFEILPTESAVPPNEAISHEQQRHLVRAAIGSLSPGLRAAYVLCVVEELPGKVAARALGIPKPACGDDCRTREVRCEPRSKHCNDELQDQMDTR